MRTTIGGFRGEDVCSDRLTGCKWFAGKGLDVAGRRRFVGRPEYELVAFDAFLGEDEVLPEHLCGPGAGALYN